MQAKLTVREVKVFNCWGLHPYPLSVNPAGAATPDPPSSSSSSFPESAPDLAVMKTSPFDADCRIRLLSPKV